MMRSDTDAPPDPRTDAPPRLPLSLRLFAILSVFALTLAVAELLARAFVPQSWLLPVGEVQVARDDRLLWQNPYLLWEPRHGYHHDGGGQVYINRLGFRGPELEPEKPAGVYRVMLTGDSSAYGFGVAEEETFIRQLERKLSARFPSVKFEGINAAAPGWSTYQSLNMLRTRGLALKPDLLIIANLFSDNNFDTFVDKEALAKLAWQRRMFELYRRLDRAVLFRSLRTVYLELRPQETPVPMKVRMATRIDPRSGKRRVEINDYARNLQQMVDEARAAGCRTAFLMLANRVDLPGDRRLAYWAPYRDVMRDLARKTQAPLADYPSVVKAHASEGGDALFLDEMHPTARGQLLMAETMFDVLLKDPALTAAWQDR